MKISSILRPFCSLPLLVVREGLKRPIFAGLIGTSMVWGVGSETPVQAANLFQQISPNSITYQESIDYSVSINPTILGDVTAPLGVVSNVGCNASDFTGFTAGNIALIARGTCSFTQKVTNAFNAGAVGIIFSNTVSGVFAPNLGGNNSPIPSILVTQTLGQQLASTSNVSVRIGVGITIPEPSLTLGFLALGTLGVVSAFKRKF